MDIAYLISAYTDAPQLRRLVKALHADAEFFVHVDANAAIAPFRRELGAEPNVHFVEPRVATEWGTVSQVEYQMAMLRAALEGRRRFDRLFILSGMDYPLWSNRRITAFLEQLGRRELLQAICLDSPDVRADATAAYRSPRPSVRIPLAGRRANAKVRAALRRLAVATGRKKPLHFEADGHTWRLYKGSDYCCLSAELARHVVATWDGCAAVRDYFRDSFALSETAIHTIALNAPEFRDRCALATGDYTTLADLTPLHCIDYAPVIRTWREADLPALLSSGKMFARKLRTGESDGLVAAIEKTRGDE